MLVDWLVIGSLPFWLITVGIVAAIIASVENEKGLWATISVAGYLAALHLAGGVDLLLWARTHVEWLAGGLVGYLILGAVWGVAKWYFFTKKKASETEENYRQARKDFLRKGIVHPADAPHCDPEQQRRGAFSRIGSFLYGSSAPADSTGKPLRRLCVPDATEETSVPEEFKGAWNEILQQGYYTMGRIELRLSPPRPNDHKSMITMWMSFWPASLFWTLLNDPVRAAFRHIYASLVRTLQDISNRAFSHVTDIQKLQRWQEKLRAPIPKYFCYSQNNIMGIMHNLPEEGIGPYVVMEAFDEEHADDRLQALMGASYYGYCDCCGRRWGNVSLIFGHLPKLSAWWNRRVIEYPYRDACYVHLLDGTIVPC